MGRVPLLAMALLAVVAFGCGDRMSAPEAREDRVNGNPGSAPDSGVEARLDAIVRAHCEAGELNGVVLIEHHGRPVLVRATGLADAELGVPNTPGTRFDLFSVTKAFTAILVLQLVDEGRIDLDHPITAYLPDYRTDTGALVSIHHLLSHSHGIPDISYGRIPEVLNVECSELLATYASGDLEFRPGTGFAYSGLAGYTILGAVIERVTGEPYADVLEQRILAPLALDDTGFMDAGAEVPGLAVSYLDSTSERRTNFFRIGCNGASSIYSTAADLTTWFEAVVGNRLLPAPLTDEMLRPRVPPERPFYGLGWYATTMDLEGSERAVVSASGGGRNVVVGVPADHNLVVLLNNVRTPGADRIAVELLEAMYDDS